jgi:glyoxylase-like metal-dependent hydrolase (beta-lactamase superfamily II)
MDRAPNGVVRVRANNPSPYTLDGTNTYVVDGRWVIDPGPADESHIDAVVAAAGDIEGIFVTHDHPDHIEGVPLLESRTGLSLSPPDAGPFEVIPTPGHAPDHVSFLRERVLFAGDTVLGAGSVFVAAGDDSLRSYLESLDRLRSLDLEVIAPGHGPFVWEPQAKVEEYIAHRLQREQKLIDALDAGARTRDEILDTAWDDVPFDEVPVLRVAAGMTLDAHLEKLRNEGRLPDGVEDS